MTRLDKTRKTKLFWAIVRVDIKSFTFLLSKGSEYDKADNSGNYLVHYAAAYRWLEILKFLIKLGVDCVNFSKINFN